MCGIFSLLNNKFHLNDELFQIVTKAFMKGKGRGPEVSTFDKVYTKTYFGFHRLAINGLNTTSNQPIYFNGKVLICNGEIYNYKELYKILDVRPTTNSDCEIILHCFERYGMDYTLQILDGVFAFIILDFNKNELYCARDTFGIRPLYKYSCKHNDLFGFSSEMKMIVPIEEHLGEMDIDQYIPGTYSKYTWDSTDKWVPSFENAPFSQLRSFFTLTEEVTQEDAFKLISNSLYNAVKKRVLTTDRPVACLLSGGLDSSLITSLVKRAIEETGKQSNLETYSIGMNGSEDLKYAKMVADFLGTKHTSIELSEKEFLDAIPEVIYAIESYDTTSVRASVGNYLVSKYISVHSDAKVIFNGDGSDELCGGYMYFHCAPDCFEFDKECRRLLKQIHMFDVQRSDRSISSNGLEPRTPFLDRSFTQMYLSLSPHIRHHKGNNQCEKYLLRKSFESWNVLPSQVLWRTKEAFSDGVSKMTRSWFQIIQEYVDVNNLGHCNEHTLNKATTNEQRYYRRIFQELFGNEKHTTVIPYFWMPRFVDATDSSARTLNIYKEKTINDK